MEFLNENGTAGGRLLWLTDTYGDHNGVSTVLKSIHSEIKSRNLPIDIMVCSSSVVPDDHLIVLKPVSEFSLPLYRHQRIRIPNMVSLHRAFKRGNYTRIICSTEGPMGFAALWLKKAFSVESSFYLHTDWLMFAREVLSMQEEGMNMLQLALRTYYRRFDNIFVLNTDQQKWLTGKKMGFDPSHVMLTAHWVDPVFSNMLNPVSHEFPFDITAPVVLYTGRISKEKGVLELPGIVTMIRSVIPEIQMVIAGTGPAEEELKKAMPDAHYLGWVGQDYLQSLFAAADILLLPSRFDTFSCVVLEALSCGLPVVAYNTKGPKDIVEDGTSGFLVETDAQMAGSVVRFLLDPDTQATMKQAAIRRAEDYRADRIMDRLLQDAGLLVESIAV
jgi:glycosyltransferase involved in cell wall biosynthesis